MSSHDLDRCRRAFACRVPLLGAWLRRRAFAALDARREDPEAIPLLSALADAADARTAGRAKSILRGVTDRAAADALCEEAVMAPRGAAASICVERALRPSDAERACLFLFVTRQLDAYFEEDFELQSLRLEYDRAPARVRAHVLDVVRSGDRRCLGFFGSQKKLGECTEREIFLALQSFLKHRDWPRLFQAFLELPLKYGLSILRELRRSGWEPDDPSHRALLAKALADSKGHVFPQLAPRPAPCALFDARIASGRTGDLARRPESDLIARLAVASPLEGVSIASALGTKPSPSIIAMRAVASSPHWLVRLAGRVAGLVPDLTLDSPSGESAWIGELSPAFPILELWPQKGTPAHLESLAEASPEAWTGHLGASRRVLRGLIAHRVTTGSFEEMVIEPDAFAGSFEPVTSFELGAVEEASP